MRHQLLLLCLLLAGCPGEGAPSAARPAGPVPAKVWSGTAAYFYDRLALDPAGAQGTFGLPSGLELAAMIEQARCPCGKTPMTREETGHPAMAPTGGHLHDMRSHQLRLGCPDGHVFTVRYHTDCWCHRAVYLCASCRDRVLTLDTGRCTECGVETQSSMLQVCLEHAVAGARCAGCDAALPGACPNCLGKPVTADASPCPGCAATKSGTQRTCVTCALRRGECSTCGAGLGPVR